MAKQPRWQPQSVGKSRQCLFEWVWPFCGFRAERIKVFPCTNIQWTSFCFSVNFHLNWNFVNDNLHFKACVRYSYQIFIFLPNDSLSKTVKNVFYFIKKPLFVLEIFSSFFSNFSLPFQTFQIQKDKWKWNILISWIGLHKFADVVFGIIQKPLYVTSSNLVR